MEFVWFILVGCAAGWLAGLVMKGRGFGFLGNLIVGVLGAVVGGWLSGLLGIAAADDVIMQIVVAAGGAVVLLFVIGLLRKG